MTGYSRPPRRFNIPRQKPSEEYDDDSDPHSGIIRGAALKNHFPIYQPPSSRLLPAEKPLEVHFDARTANRQMAAGHYDLSQLVGQARLDKQKELKEAHEETKRVRQELGAESKRVGGMVAPTCLDTKTNSRLKRKAEADERRDIVKAKRMKKTIAVDMVAPPPASNEAPANAASSGSV